MADQLLDAKGLNCPLPILRTKKALKDMAIGDVLTVQATDPGAVKDFEAFCRTTGNELVDSSNANGEYHFRIRRKQWMKKSGHEPDAAAPRAAVNHWHACGAAWIATGHERTERRSHVLRGLARG